MKHFRSIKELVAELTAWIAKNPDSPTLRLNGKLAGANPAAWFVFPVEGFDDSDFKPTAADIGHDIWKGTNGSDFNVRFALAGDTQQQAVKEFLALYEKHQGDIRKILRPGFATRGDGTPGRMKLFLCLESPPVGWNCLKYQK